MTAAQPRPGQRLPRADVHRSLTSSVGGAAAQPAPAARPQGQSDEVAIALAHSCAQHAATLAGVEAQQLHLPAIIGPRASRLLGGASRDAPSEPRQSPSNEPASATLPGVAAALEAGAAELLRMSEAGLLAPAAALHSGLVLAAAAQAASSCVTGAAAAAARAPAPAPAPVAITKPVARLPGATDPHAAGEVGALARAAAAAAEAAALGLLGRRDGAGAAMVAELAAADALAAAALLQLVCLVRPTHGAPGAGWLRASERDEPWPLADAVPGLGGEAAGVAASAAAQDSERLCGRLEASAYGEGGKPGSRASGAFDGVRAAGRMARPGERAAALLAAEVAVGIGATLATELCRASRGAFCGESRAGGGGWHGATAGAGESFWAAPGQARARGGSGAGGEAAAAARVATLLLAGAGPGAACSPLVGAGLACLPASLARQAPEEALAWWPPETVLALLESAAAGSAAVQACAPSALETPVARAGVGAAGVWARVLEAALFHAERAAERRAADGPLSASWEASAIQLTRCVAAASAARVLDDARLRLDAAAAAARGPQQKPQLPPAAGPEAAVSLLRLSQLAAERRGQATGLPAGGWLPWAVLRGSSAACSDRLAVSAVSAAAALATAVREALAASGAHLPPLRAARGTGGPADALEMLAPPARGWREQLLGRRAARRAGRPEPPPDRADLPVAAAPSAVRLVPASEAGAAASAARRRVQRRLGFQRRDAPSLHGEELAVSPGPVSGSFSVLERLDGARPPLAADGSPVLSVAAVDGGAPDGAIDECVGLAIEAEGAAGNASAASTSGSALLWLAEPPPRPADEPQEDALAAFFAADDSAACLVMDEEEVDATRTYALEQRRTGQGAAVRTVLRLSEATASLTAAGGGVLPWEPAWAGDDATARGAWEDAPKEGDVEGWAHVTQALVEAASQRSGMREREGAASSVRPAEHAEAGPMSALAAAALLATARCTGAEQAAYFAWCVWPADAEPRGEGDSEAAAAVLAALACGFGPCMPPSLRHVATDASAAVLQALAGGASRASGALSAARNLGHVSVGGQAGAALGALLAGTAEPYGMLQPPPLGLAGRAWFSAHARAVALPAQECVAVLREAAAGHAAAPSGEEDEPGAALTPGRTGPMGMYAPLGYPLLRLQPQLSRLRAEGACSLRRAAWLELPGLAEGDTEAALDVAVLLVHALHSAVCEPAAEADGTRSEGLLAEARGCLAALAELARCPAVDVGVLRAAAEAGPGARADVARRVLRLREERLRAQP